MLEVKRSRFIALQFGKLETFDLALFLRGEISTQHQALVFAISGLTGMRLELSISDCMSLGYLSEEVWEMLSPSSQFSSESVVEALLEGGFLLQRGTDDPQLRSLLLREELAESSWWNPLALTYFQYSAKQFEPQVIDYEKDLLEADRRADEFVSSVGPPPSPFGEYGKHGSRRKLLPSHWKECPLGSLLLQRHTNRLIDPQEQLSLDDLTFLLEAAFRPHSMVSIGTVFEVLRKTSPSGGSLHPIEAFVSAPAVNSLPSGIYHYAAKDHCLVPISEIPQERLRELNIKMAGLQEFVGRAPVLIILIARFARHHWKYRNRARALSIINADAGHIGQTLYLLATHLKLAFFYTGSVDVEVGLECLGLDPISEGLLAVCGCGKPSLGGLQELKPKATYS